MKLIQDYLHFLLLLFFENIPQKNQSGFGWNGPTAAALCHTQSAPLTSSATVSLSQMSPTRHSIFGWVHALAGGGTMSKLMTLSAPRSTSISTRRSPTKPVPPVTTQRFGTGGCAFLAACSCSGELLGANSWPSPNKNAILRPARHGGAGMPVLPQ